MLSCPEAVKMMFKRQQAGWPAFKNGNGDNRKSRENSSHAAEVWGTHTTLPLSVSAVPAKLQKTAILAVSRLAIHGGKGLLCSTNGYSVWIKYIYPNDLQNVRSVTLPASGRR